VGWIYSPFLLCSAFFYECMADLFVLTNEALAGMDVELIDVERAALGLIRVTIDRPEGVTVSDCHRVSNQLTRVFEVENLDYKRLEVGSPGIDRPLRTEADFQRFLGERAEIKLRMPNADGRKVFTGTLVSAPAPTSDDAAAPDEAGTKAVVFGLEFEAKKNDMQVVTFSVQDLDRAKLDPVLDFKGKKR